jgi:hypothetical protein
LCNRSEIYLHVIILLLIICKILNCEKCSDCPSRRNSRNTHGTFEFILRVYLDICFLKHSVLLHTQAHLMLDFFYISNYCAKNICLIYFFYHGATAPTGPRPPHSRGFMITFRHTTLSRAPLDEFSARRSDFYLTTHNTHKRQTSIPPSGFKPTIPASERPQTRLIHN